MKLYVRPSSIFKMQNLYDHNEFLRKALYQDSATSWLLETDNEKDLAEIKKLLRDANINFYFK